jgi:hypothetical protein
MLSPRRWKRQRHNDSRHLGGAADGLVLFGVGVDPHHGGPARHADQDGEVGDLHLLPRPPGGLSNVQAAAVVTHCTVVAAATDTTAI